MHVLGCTQRVYYISIFFGNDSVYHTEFFLKLDSRFHGNDRVCHPELDSGSKIADRVRNDERCPQ